MMVSVYLILALLLVTPSPGVLEVEITGIDQVSGYMRVGIYDSADDFLRRSMVSKNQEVTARGKMTITFEDLPYGQYVVSIYHDINNNNILDSNIFRIPKEPYGFSTNPGTFFGPPDFEEAVISHQSSCTSITIEL